MHPNVGALIVIVLGLVLVYVAVRGSQSTFFGSFLKGGGSSSSSSKGVGGVNVGAAGAGANAAMQQYPQEWGVVHNAARGF